MSRAEAQEPPPAGDGPAPRDELRTSLGPAERSAPAADQLLYGFVPSETRRRPWA